MSTLSAPTARRAVPSIAELQAGVFTPAQARAEGWSDGSISHRIARQQWVYVAGRALSEPQDQWSTYQLAVAGQLSLPDAVISHRTAADLHWFPGLADPKHAEADPSDRLFPDSDQVHPPLTCCDVTLAGRRTSGRAIELHRQRVGYTDIDTKAWPGLRVTTAARTAIDCLASWPLRAALDLWPWLVTARILDRGQLDSAIAARRNWNGTPQLRRIRGLVAGGAVRSAEHRFHDLLRSHGVSGWEAEVPITDAEGLIGIVDAAFAAERVVIEIHGFGGRLWRTATREFWCRNNRLVVADQVRLIYFWEHLIYYPAAVIAQLTDTLRHRGRSI